MDSEGSLFLLPENYFCPGTLKPKNSTNGSTLARLSMAALRLSDQIATINKIMNLPTHEGVPMYLKCPFHVLSSISTTSTPSCTTELLQGIMTSKNEKRDRNLSIDF